MAFPLQAVLLDNNGTAFDDLHVSFAAACAIFDHYGVPHPTLEQYRTEITSSFTDFYWNHGIPRTATREELNVIRRRYYEAHIHEASYRQGVPEFLHFCRARRLKVAMVSSEIPAVLAMCLAREGLILQFDDIRPGAWPSKIPFLVQTLVKLGVMPEQAVYVDDSVGGIADAKAIGMRTIGFVHPTASAGRALIMAAEPETTAEDFYAVMPILIPWL